MKKIVLSSILAFGVVIPFVFLSFRPVPTVPAGLSRLAAPLAIDLEKAANNWIKTASDFDFKGSFSRTNPESDYLYYALFNLGEYLDIDIRKSGLKDEEDCEKRNETNSYCYLRSFRNKVIFQVYRSPALREVAYAWLLPDWKRAVAEMDDDRKLLLGKILNHMVVYTAKFDYGKELAFYNSCRGENEYLFVSEYPVKNGEEDYDSDNTNPYRRAEAWVFRRIHQKHLTIGEITQWFSRIKKDLALPEADESIVFYPGKCKKLYRSGLEKFENKNFAGAIEDYSQGIALIRKSLTGLVSADAHGLYMLASAKIELKNFKEAIPDLDEAILLNNNKASYFLKRGFAHNELHNQLQAMSDYNKANELDSEYDEPYFFRGLLNYRKNNFQEAEKDFSNYLKHETNFSGFYYRGNCRLILENYEGAVKDFSDAMKIDFQRKEAHSDRGYAYYFLEKYQEALNDLNLAAVMDSKNNQVYYRRGLVKSAMMNHGDALKDFNESISLANDHAPSYYSRGIVKSEMKDYEGAIDDYKKAILLNPEKAQYYSRLSTGYSLMKNYPLAIETAQKGLKLKPDYLTLWGNLGYTYLEVNKYDAALQSFLQSYQLENNNIDVLLGLSVCSYLLKDKKNALSYFEKARLIKPELVKGLEGLALLESEGYYYSDVFKLQFEKMSKKLLRK